MLRDTLPETSASALWDCFVAPEQLSASTVMTIAEPTIRDAAPVRRAVTALVNSSLYAERSDTVLAAHELLANAILHARGPVHLAIAVTPDFNLVAVHDSSPALPPSTDDTYHGLWILSRLSRGQVHVIPVVDDGKWIAVLIADQPDPVVASRS
jgi:hypothetical protein